MSSDANPEFDFSNSRSFKWASQPPLIKTGDFEISDEIAERMKTAIRAAFEAKGYQFVSAGQADLAVSYTMGARSRIEIIDFPDVYVKSYDDWAWGQSYYGPGYVSPNHGSSLNVQELELAVGTLSIDVFDTRGRRPVWHAQAEKILNDAERRGASQSKLNADAVTMLQDFPARSVAQ